MLLIFFWQGLDHLGSLTKGFPSKALKSPLTRHAEEMRDVRRAIEIENICRDEISLLPRTVKMGDLPRVSPFQTTLDQIKLISG